MSKFIKITAMLLAVLTLMTCFTACGKKDKTEDTTPSISEESKPDESKPTDEVPEDTVPTTPQIENINGRFVIKNGKGIYIITSDAAKYKEVYDEIDTDKTKLYQKGKTHIAFDLLKSEIGRTTVKFNPQFELADSFAVGISKEQDESTRYEFSTNGYLMTSQCFTSNIQIFCMANRSVELQNAVSDFTYSFSETNDDRLLNKIVISGRVGTMTNIHIFFDGEKYIVTSTEEIGNIKVTLGLTEDEQQDFNLDAVFSTRFHIVINDDGTASIIVPEA